MMCAAAGFAHTGYVPFVSTFALFGAGRAFEQIRNSICYTNCNVKFGFSHSGLCVGEDGGAAGRKCICYHQNTPACV